MTAALPGARKGWTMRIEAFQEELARGGVQISRRELLMLAAAGGAALTASPLLTRSAGAQDATTPTPGGIWRMAIAGTPTVYPVTAPAALVDLLVNKTIYNNLTQYQLVDGGIQAVPDLAESWEPNADLTQWTFRLRPGVLWHDGTPLTAADVKFTFETLLNPEVNAAARGVISSIQTIDAVDDLTVMFTLSRAFAPLPVMLGYNQAIVPKHLLEGQDLNQPAAFLAAPVGSGPFKYKELSAGNYLEVSRNDAYFGGPALLDGIIFKTITDGNARAAQIRSGEIDLTVIDPSQVESMQSDPNIVLREMPQVNYYFVAVNHSIPRLQDRRVRQALSHVLDKDAIVQSVLAGAGQVATGPIHPFLGDYYNPNVQTYAYDPEAAAALMTEAGWTKGEDGILVNAAGERFTLRINGPQGYPVLEQVMVYAQSEFQQLGIEVTLEIPEWTVHLEQYNELQYDLLVQWWVTPPDPDLYDHYYSTSSSNRWGYNNPELDPMLVEARSQSDRAARVALVHQLQEMVAIDLPVLYLYHVQEIQAVSARTQGLVEMGYRDALTWSEQIWVTQ